MASVPLLTTYCLLIALASLGGGAFPMLARLSHTGMQVAISFVGGMMLGVGILHMMPHAATAIGDARIAAGWLLAGFVAMFFLQRFSHFHHHEPAESESATTDVGRSAEEPVGQGRGVNDAEPPHTDHESAFAQAGCTHGPECDGHQIGPGPPITWTTFALGLGLHSLLDGVALAASVQADQQAGHLGLPGLATFLAILLHKPFDSLTVTLLMAGRGASVLWRQWINIMFAVIVPVGVFLFYFGFASSSSMSGLTGPALGFAAGVFICIASSDLLPEVQFHSHDRGRLSMALLFGICLAAIIEFSHRH